MIKVSNQFYKIWFAWKQVLMNIPYAFMGIDYTAWTGIGMVVL